VIEDVEIRRARAEEEEAALRLVYEPPGPEASGIAGGESRARALGAAPCSVSASTGDRTMASWWPLEPGGRWACWWGAPAPWGDRGQGGRWR